MKVKKCVIALLLFGLTGCGSAETDTETKSDGANTAAATTEYVEPLANDPDYKTTLENARYLSEGGVWILRSLYTGNENIVFSPISVDMAMGIAAAGADEETETRIMRVLLPEQSSEILHKEMRSYREHMSYSPDLKWNIENAVWSNKEVKENYKSILTSFYDASIHIDHASEDLHLVNTLSFRGKWSTAFAPAGKMEITAEDGSKGEVDAMFSECYAQLDWCGGTGFVKTYEGSEFTFVAILPPEGMSIKDYLDRCCKESNFADIYKSATATDIKVKIPKFHTESSISMKKAITELGADIFTQKADFSQICDDGTSLSDILQKTEFSITEAGTKAPAATLEEVTGSETVTMEFNRPFVYAVVDDITGMPLIMGVQCR